MRYSNNLVLTILAAVVFAGVAHGAPAVINFEGFGSSNDPLPEGTPLPSVVRQGVKVDFLTEADDGTTTLPFITEVGSPRVAFQSVSIPTGSGQIVGDDFPVNEDKSRYLKGGDYSLTDGLRQTHDYIISFSSNVLNLSLDLYDFRADGPHDLGNPGSDTVVLKVFDAAGNELGSDAYTVTDPRPRDGNVVSLGVDVSKIRSARLVFNAIDGGTSIDNIVFTVPEPSGLGLAALALCGLLGLRGRQR
jgi:hypothetical protein